jgi:prevent-host-death family protein
MATFSIQQAKAQLSKLVAMACRGEEVIITRWKRPVVKIVALAKQSKANRIRGA